MSLSQTVYSASDFYNFCFVSKAVVFTAYFNEHFFNFCRRIFPHDYFPICIFLFLFYFIFKFYIIVLVLPNIKMNPPQVYMCSPS